MRSYVIFSNEEVEGLINGMPIYDEINGIVYVNENGYEKIRKDRFPMVNDILKGDGDNDRS